MEITQGVSHNNTKSFNETCIFYSGSQQSGPHQAGTVETEIRTLDRRTYFGLNQPERSSFT